MISVLFAPKRTKAAIASIRATDDLGAVGDLQTQNRPSGATHPGRLRTQGRGFPQRPMMTVRSDDDGAFER
ncbi:hypothetical protein [Novosphingobium resinovorum]|uniref:hypothetical protein n=1 Tax=Novosphingobium resinovorum TaxID=158500 RepID=UPI0018D4B138|nr:hypothetical protein [Novosphingobium resinovorum]